MKEQKPRIKIQFNTETLEPRLSVRAPLAVKKEVWCRAHTRLHKCAALVRDWEKREEVPKDGVVKTLALWTPGKTWPEKATWLKRRTDEDVDPDTLRRRVARELLPLLVLGLLTGARKGELENMQWSEIDLVERLWRIPAEHTKTKKARTVPLSPGAVAVLMRQPGRATNERVWPVRDFGSRFASAVVEAQLAEPRPTFHALRHSAISRLHKAGVPVGTIQKLVGHSTGKNITLGTYTTVELAELRAAVEALERRFRCMVVYTILPHRACKSLKGRD